MLPPLARASDAGDAAWAAVAVVGARRAGTTVATAAPGTGVVVLGTAAARTKMVLNEVRPFVSVLVVVAFCSVWTSGLRDCIAAPWVACLDAVKCVALLPTSCPACRVGAATLLLSILAIFYILDVFFMCFRCRVPRLHPPPFFLSAHVVALWPFDHSLSSNTPFSCRCCCCVVRKCRSSMLQVACASSFQNC